MTRRGHSRHFSLHASKVLVVFFFLVTISSCNIKSEEAATPSSGVVIHNALEAIAAVQAQYPKVSGIRTNLTAVPFDPDRVTVLEQDERWDLIFSTGTGDCPSGCLNNYYWYFSVWTDGKVEKMGEFSRVFVPSSNDYEEKGNPMWGYPR